MSEAEQHHQLEETPPGDARDPAGHEVDPADLSRFPRPTRSAMWTPTPQTDDPVAADAAGDVGPDARRDAHRQMANGERGGHLIRTVDFSQPTKFTAELRRRILRSLGSFCEAFALRLSTELRAPVELAVADSSQLTWAAAKAQLPANTIAVALGSAADQRADAALHRAARSCCRRSSACSAGTPPRPPPNGASAKSTGRSRTVCCNR